MNFNLAEKVFFHKSSPAILWINLYILVINEKIKLVFTRKQTVFWLAHHSESYTVLVSEMCKLHPVLSEDDDDDDANCI